MSRVPFLASLDYNLNKRDKDWISHQLPKESIEIPREHLPDPETENLPSSVSFRQESTAELEKRWTDTGIDRIFLNRPRPSRPSCSKNDEMIKRFLEIPKFYPILKSSLNQPDLRDSPEATPKVNARPVLKFACRLQEHFSRCANTVVVEQESLGNSMKHVDRNITLLLVQFAEQKRSMDRFQNYLEKMNDLQAHISNLRFLFQDLMPVINTLNEILPEHKRLPLLDIDCLVNATEGSSEQRKHAGIIREIQGGTYLMDNNQDDVHIKPVDEMKPLATKQVVAFVNYFMVKNVQILQDFVSNVERRIIDMEKRLSRVEVELKLLELKLDSVPSLQIIVSEDNEVLAKQRYNGPLFNQISAEDTVEDEIVENVKVDNSESLLASNSLPSIERSSESMASKTSLENQNKPNSCLRIRDDPRYAIYFRMLKMGVPECAVKQKMATEGIDIALLQTPDALSDLPVDAAASIEDKDSTSADDDDQDSTSSSDR
ncbi:unnamed protein product [Brugia pahangi]|uniref:BLOC-1-related complex subunit 5 n=1 Tax=Brugia pahangi TaxID=6280 RepID=A0A0N4TTU3_BRUPA|nr:unnamed protein product [Brugia pahangi]